jgi:hypothetical protein
MGAFTKTVACAAAFLFVGFSDAYHGTECEPQFAACAADATCYGIMNSDEPTCEGGGACEPTEDEDGDPDGTCTGGDICTFVAAEKTGREAQLDCAANTLCHAKDLCYFMEVDECGAEMYACLVDSTCYGIMSSDDPNAHLALCQDNAACSAYVWGCPETPGKTSRTTCVAPGALLVLVALLAN